MQSPWQLHGTAGSNNRTCDVVQEQSILPWISFCGGWRNKVVVGSAHNPQLWGSQQEPGLPWRKPRASLILQGCFPGRGQRVGGSRCEGAVQEVRVGAAPSAPEQSHPSHHHPIVAAAAQPGSSRGEEEEQSEQGWTAAAQAGCGSRWTVPGLGAVGPLDH